MLTADVLPGSPQQPPAETDANPCTHESDSSLSSGSESDSGDGFIQFDGAELAPPPQPPLTDLIPKNVDGSLWKEGRKHPAVQVMARSEAYDGRIPPSVFERSSPPPAEWSLASNESLFSIYMGNMSFSRDHVFLMERSGELGGLANNVKEYSLQAGNGNCGEGMGELGGMIEKEAAAASANAEAMRDVMRAAAEGKEKKMKPPEPLWRSISRHSDVSNSSFRSFAFPILTGDEKFESAKVDSMHHFERHPLALINPLKAKVAANAAVLAPSPAPAKKSWFPCFSCCKFCR